MQNKISDKTLSALAELKQSHDNLSWLQKLFYSSAVSAALIEYDTENPTEESVKAIYEAYNNKTWFFQRWFFPLIKQEIIPPTYPTAILVQAIGAFLDPSDRAQLARTNKSYNTLFQPRLSNDKLLSFVAKGKQDEADAMLSKHPQLLLQRGNVTDYSGRSFANISALEYAYWALDTYMCRMLEKHIMALEPSSREKTKAIMLERIDKIEKDKLSYRQAGITKSSRHFSFEPCKNTLLEYSTLAQFDMETDDRKVGFWRQLGTVQLDFPVHVANEYCHSVRSFSPTPDFNDSTLPRDLHLNTHRPQDFILPLLQLWLGPMLPQDWYSFPGTRFRGHNAGAFGIMDKKEEKTDSLEFAQLIFRARQTITIAQIDLLALIQLNDTRLSDLQRFKSDLQPSIRQP